MQKSPVQQYRTPDSNHLHVVVRFLRRVTLPRFGMDAQETFGFVVVGKHAQMVQNIMRGERFGFGGGQVLAEDVDLAFLGPCSGDYVAAIGGDALIFTGAPEPFALDFLVSPPEHVQAPAAARQLCTVEGSIPGLGHFGAGHWAQILQVIRSEFVSEGDAAVVHFAGGLPLELLALEADPLKIEGLKVHRKGVVEPAYALLPNPA